MTLAPAVRLFFILIVTTLIPVFARASEIVYARHSKIL